MHLQAKQKKVISSSGFYFVTIQAYFVMKGTEMDFIVDVGNKSRVGSWPMKEPPRGWRSPTDLSNDMPWSDTVFCRFGGRTNAVTHIGHVWMCPCSF